MPSRIEDYAVIGNCAPKLLELLPFSMAQIAREQSMEVS